MKSSRRVLSLTSIGPGRTMCRVLIVDSDANARELARAFLADAGHVVSLAADGAEAIAHIAEAPPQVVLTEIMIRKIDGLALCRRVKTDPATDHIRVVVFSVLSAAVRSQEAGADGFLKKPLTERKLVDAIASAIAIDARAQKA
jgi:CheY-like chemotaxis protein